MVKIQQNSDSILIENISQTKIEPEETLNLCKSIQEKLTKSVSSLIFDLKGVKSTDYTALTFIKAVAEMPSTKDYAFILQNADEELLLALKKLGFDNNAYLQKEFRKEEVKSIFETTGEGIFKILNDTRKLIIYTEDLLQTLLYYIRHPRKLNKNDILYYADKTGADAVPIVMMICFLMGVILAFQGLAQLSRFGLSIFVSNLVGFSIVRELGPLMVAIICTGRAGSAFAAELGTMKVNEEIDAMTTMGLKPVYILVMPKLVALIIVMPMLTILGDFIGILGGGLITAAASDISFYEYIDQITGSMIPANIFESITKSVVFAFLVAAIGCFRGLDSDNDAKGVGNATTSAVVSGIFLIVLADTALTFIYPQLMHLFGIDY
jgi:phospholipid/cholesterol/gamma-HCH transport system permease protein